MKIDALTTCTGDLYAKYLTKSLPIWADTCDRVFVVTDKDTLDPLLASDDVDKFSNVYFLVTDLFQAHGASFNKGAALSHGFACIPEPQWILNFDSDIIPPPGWRKIVEPQLSPGKLFGFSHRYREDGSQIPDANYPNIWGFFHLWHVDDSHSWKRPVYTVDCGHAGNYDHTFMMQWPNKDRVDLWPAVKLIHQGEPRQSWFGNDPKNEKKMLNLFTLGLYEAWITKAGHIKTPPFEREIVLDHQNLNVTRQLLREFTDPDPFKYKVEVKGTT